MKRAFFPDQRPGDAARLLTSPEPLRQARAVQERFSEPRSRFDHNVRAFKEMREGYVSCATTTRDHGRGTLRR
jgi:hypothetical protein